MIHFVSFQIDSRDPSAVRRQQLNKQRSEGEYGENKLYPESNVISIQPKGSSFSLSRININEPEKKTHVLQNGFPNGLRSYRTMMNSDYLTDKQISSDILAESVRRQSLKGSKHSLSESNLGNIRESTNLQTHSETFRTRTPEDVSGFRSEPNGLNDSNIIRRTSVIPSSHEDIQILNLQGFMDFSRATDSTKLNEKKKQRKRRSRHNDGVNSVSSRDGYKTGLKSRDRKRRGRTRRNVLSEDDEDDIILKDIDDIDDRISGIVLGPKSFTNESVGKPITLEEASELRSILTGNPTHILPTEWMTQNFFANTNSNLSYGLVQRKVIS